MPTAKSQDKNIRIGGTRPRPRVALLGHFLFDEVKRYKKLFPTVWEADSVSSLDNKVHLLEVDLIIINPKVTHIPSWLNSVHVICFSEDVGQLPGPISRSEITISNSGIETEIYALPEIDLPFSRRRDTDFTRLDHVKGWRYLDIQYHSDLGFTDLHGIALPGKSQEEQKAFNIIAQGAIIYNPYTNCPFATIFKREKSRLGVAWLPQPIFNRIAWVELIVTEWAQSDRIRFPDFGDWTKLPEWLVPKEEELAQKVSALENKKQETIRQIEEDIGKLQSDLTQTTLDANKGVRRLLTAQGDELVEEVADILTKIGFKVQPMDKELDDNTLRREDLRLKDPSEQEQAWEAIVEVRGYRRSAGTTADLLRLDRFAELYQRETGRWPDKRVYVVNGQLELQPSQRQEPLASASEDLEVFAEKDGVLISTIDLFRIAQKLQQLDRDIIRESIKRAKGRWTEGSVTSGATPRREK
jgi:hypothetical protein